MKKTLAINYKGYTIDRIYNEHNESLGLGSLIPDAPIQRSISDYPFTDEQRFD